MLVCVFFFEFLETGEGVSNTKSCDSLCVVVSFPGKLKSIVRIMLLCTLFLSVKRHTDIHDSVEKLNSLPSNLFFPLYTMHCTTCYSDVFYMLR